MKRQGKQFVSSEIILEGWYDKIKGGGVSEKKDTPESLGHKTLESRYAVVLFYRDPYSTYR